MTVPRSVSDALASWCYPVKNVEPMVGGGVNQHFRVETDSGDLGVLRRYNARHPAESTSYEHSVLRHLEGLGWPVAAPLPTPTMQYVIETDEGRWSLFPFLFGSPPPSRDPLFLQRKGVLLALVQRDLTSWESPAQRPGFGRVTDLDTPLRSSGFEGFDALIDELRRSDATRAEALYALRERNRETLGRRGYGELADWTVWYECLGNNILFTEDNVTGLLDFDFSHRDARVADAARSLVVDCGTDTTLISRWLAGYATFSDPSLSIVEADLIPDLMLASAIWNAVVPLSIAASGGPAWMLESARRDIDEVLPRLRDAVPGLRYVTRAAAGLSQRSDPPSP